MKDWSEHTGLAAALVTAQYAERVGSAAALIEGSSIAEQFEGDNLDVKRTLVEAFVEVRLFPHPRGQKAFDPETVKITPKSA